MFTIFPATDPVHIRTNVAYEEEEIVASVALNPGNALVGSSGPSKTLPACCRLSGFHP